ncbi:MAG: hypothetical protein Q8L48_04565 [Archangium sp.]|nr:hypothetical protein [Archangium sp.]
MKPTFAVALFLLLTASPAFAAGSVTATVSSVRVDAATGRGFIFFSTNISTPATCAASANYSMMNVFAFDTTTAGGKSILSLAASAKLAGRTITAFGTGTCLLYPRTETCGSGLCGWGEDISYMTMN